MLTRADNKHVVKPAAEREILFYLQMPAALVPLTPGFCAYSMVGHLNEFFISMIIKNLGVMPYAHSFNQFLLCRLQIQSAFGFVTEANETGVRSRIIKTGTRKDKVSVFGYLVFWPTLEYSVHYKHI